MINRSLCACVCVLLLNNSSCFNGDLWKLPLKTKMTVNTCLKWWYKRGLAPFSLLLQRYKAISEWNLYVVSWTFLKELDCNCLSKWLVSSFENACKCTEWIRSKGLIYSCYLQSYRKEWMKTYEGSSRCPKASKCFKGTSAGQGNWLYVYSNF